MNDVTQGLRDRVGNDLVPAYRKRERRHLAKVRHREADVERRVPCRNLVRLGPHPGANQSAEHGAPANMMRICLTV